MTGELWVDVPNARSPCRGICTGGRPQKHQVQQACLDGIKKVVSLCSAFERGDFDEGEFVRALGMDFLNIPISGPADLNLPNAKLLAAALVEDQGRPMLIHCASGNRVGALFALKARFVDECSIEQSLNIGRAAGLTTLEPEVRCIFAGL